MRYNQVYREIKREYELLRQKADRIIKQRKEAAYEASPRLKILENALMQAAMEVSRIVVLADKTPEESVQSFKEKVEKIKNEKNDVLKDMGLDESYFTQVYCCNLCNDTGYMENQMCSCMKQKLVDKYYDIANVRDIVKRENFDTFDFRYYSEKLDETVGISPDKNMQLIYKSCMDFVNNFETEFQNILLYGHTGLGKTFLCNCIAKEIIDKERTVLYATAPQLFKKIEEFRFNREESNYSQEHLDMVYDVDLLIIDDLGSEFSTIVTNTELFNILNARMIERKRIIISTNLTLTDLQSSYSDRIVSRIFGNYRKLRFIGDDIRVKKQLGF